MASGFCLGPGLWPAPAPSSVREAVAQDCFQASCFESSISIQPSTPSPARTSWSCRNLGQSFEEPHLLNEAAAPRGVAPGRGGVKGEGFGHERVSPCDICSGLRCGG